MSPEALDIISRQSPESLQRYIMIEWAGWALLILCLSSSAFLLWRKREILETDHVNWGTIGALVLGICSLLLLLCFFPYSLKVFLCPELEALRSITGKN